jgi:hypothetical protein
LYIFHHFSSIDKITTLSLMKRVLLITPHFFLIFTENFQNLTLIIFSPSKLLRNLLVKHCKKIILNAYCYDLKFPLLFQFSTLDIIFFSTLFLIYFSSTETPTDIRTAVVWHPCFKSSKSSS